MQSFLVISMLPEVCIAQGVRGDGIFKRRLVRAKDHMCSSLPISTAGYHTWPDKEPSVPPPGRRPAVRHAENQTQISLRGSERRSRNQRPFVVGSGRRELPDLAPHLGWAREALLWRKKGEGGSCSDYKGNKGLNPLGVPTGKLAPSRTTCRRVPRHGRSG